MDLLIKKYSCLFEMGSHNLLHAILHFKVYKLTAPNPELKSHLEDALSADGAVVRPVWLYEVALGAVSDLLWSNITFP